MQEDTAHVEVLARGLCALFVVMAVFMVVVMAMVVMAMVVVMRVAARTTDIHNSLIDLALLVPFFLFLLFVAFLALHLPLDIRSSLLEVQDTGLSQRRNPVEG
jgi:hypothetical protein